MSASESATDGNSIQLNGFLPLNLLKDLEVLSDGTVWLKTGTVETDIASYPDATVANIGVSYTGNSVLIEPDFNHGGVAWDGTHFWLTHTGNTYIYKFDSNWVYTDELFNIGITPQGICWDGTHFWIVQTATGIIHQFGTDMVATGTTIDTSSTGLNKRDIAWDGTHFWITDSGNNRVCQYLPNGTNVANHAINPESTLPWGIDFDGTYLWVVMNGDDKVYNYLPNETMGYQGISFDHSAQNSGLAYGIIWDGTDLNLVMNTDNTLYKYKPIFAVGLTTEYTEYGSPVYTRIK